MGDQFTILLPIFIASFLKADQSKFARIVVGTAAEKSNEMNSIFFSVLFIKIFACSIYIELTKIAKTRIIIISLYKKNNKFTKSIKFKFENINIAYVLCFDKKLAMGEWFRVTIESKTVLRGERMKGKKQVLGSLYWPFSFLFSANIKRKWAQWGL